MEDPRALRRPTSLSASFPSSLVGASLAVLLGFAASGCNRSSSGGAAPGTTTPNTSPLVVDFGLRFDLRLGNGAIGDVLHVDIDGDAFAVGDVVESNFLPQTITIAQGRTDGSFVQLIEKATLGHPWKLASGDFDGDGLVDIAAVSLQWPGPKGTGASALEVFLQGPNPGEFTASGVTLLFDSNPVDLAVAPSSGVPGSSGPGNPDEIFVALRTEDEVARVELRSGLNGFELVQTETLESSPLGGAGGPFSIAVLDFDRDGFLDVLVGEDQVPGAPDRLVRYHRDGPGFFEPADFVVGPLMQPLIQNVGDVDGDGFDDLSIAQLQDTRVFLVRFDDAATPLLSSIEFGARTTSLVFHDLDGDGQAEAIATTLNQNSIQVLPSNGPLAWGEAMHYNVGRKPRAIDVVFLPGDAIPDLLCGNAQDLSVLVGLATPTGQPTGLFRGARGYANTPNDVVTFPESIHPRAVAVADLDNDLDLDAVTVSRSQFAISFLEGAGDGTFEAQSSLPLAPGADDLPGHAVITDLDGDGNKDVVITVEAVDEVRVYRGTGSVSGFQPPTGNAIIGVGDGPLGLAAGDLDGQNGEDIVVANSESQTVQVLLNDGTGRLVAQAAAGIGFHAGGVLVADLDADSDADVAVVGWDSGGWILAILAGDGTGALGMIQTFPLDGSTGSFLAADFDGNGLPEIVVGQGTPAITGVHYFANQGNLSFDARRVQVGFGPSRIAAHDIDNDGNEDLVVGTTAGNLVMKLGDGNGNFPTQIPAITGELPITEGLSGLALGDVNGDGLQDLLTVTSGSAFVWVGLNTSVPVNTTP